MMQKNYTYHLGFGLSDVCAWVSCLRSEAFFDFIYLKYYLFVSLLIELTYDVDMVCIKRW